MTAHLIADILEENKRSKQKYPPAMWERLTKRQMLWALLSEVWELARAMWRHDVDGPHGIIAEAIQCGNVAMRIAEEMERRE